MLRTLAPVRSASSRLGRLQVLIVGGDSDSLLNARGELQTSDAELDLTFVLGGVAAIERAHQQLYDVVVIDDGPQLDAAAWVSALQAIDQKTATVVVLSGDNRERLAAVCQSGADGWVTRAELCCQFPWLLRRAVDRRRLLTENRRLRRSEERRLELDHQNAQRLLQQQRELLCELDRLRGTAQQGAALPSAMPHGATERGPVFRQLGPSDDRSTAMFPAELEAHYRSLLRAHVAMAEGNLAFEAAALAETLARMRLRTAHAVRLHHRALEALLEDLGQRATPHVLQRADMLVMELLVHLAEAYRRECAA